MLDLEATLPSSNKVTLTWEAPNKPNGIIKNYTVTLEVSIIFFTFIIVYNSMTFVDINQKNTLI